MNALVEYANQLIERSQVLEKKLVGMLPDAFRNIADVGFLRGAVNVMTTKLDKSSESSQSSESKESTAS